MAKVIKMGTAPVFTARVTCRECKSLVEYESGDVEGDQRDGNYVRCPVCKVLTDSAVLKWKQAKS